jgi:hypothetical protein
LTLSRLIWDRESPGAVIYRQRESEVRAFIGPREPSGLEGARTNRSALVNAAFAAVFAVLAAFAAATAAGTTSPWFTAELSGIVYETTIIVAVISAFVLVAFSATHVARLEEARRAIDLRMAMIPERVHLPTGAEVTITPELVRTIPPSDDEIDELLTTLATPSANAVPQEEFGVAGTLVEVSAALTAARTRKEVLTVLLRERARVQADRARVAGTVVAPIALALLLAAMAGAMMPGVQGFAAANFQLNTGLVLFLAYGLAFLVAWSLAMLASLVGRAPESGEGVEPTTKSKPQKTH